MIPLGARRWLVDVGAVAGAGILLYACGGPAPGTIRGHLLDRGPARILYGLNTSPETVEVLSKGHVVGQQRIGAGEAFHFSEPPGSYTFTVAPWRWLCVGTAKVTSGTMTTVDAKCTGGGSAG